MRPTMNFKKDDFTDAAQVGEMNRTVWETLGGHRETPADAAPASGDSVPTAQSTTVADDAGVNSTDIPPTK